jgi:hypothetical protein
MTDELLGVGMPCGGVMDVYIDPVLPRPEFADCWPRPHCQNSRDARTAHALFSYGR